MNVNVKAAVAASMLIKTDPSAPCLFLTAEGVAIASGTRFHDRLFDQVTLLPEIKMTPGTDYFVTLNGEDLAIVDASKLVVGDDVLGGFHFAPGGNAKARAGGDEVPAINPCSFWDVNFRPACDDPRGMAVVEKPGGRFWCDIYLLGVDHAGTCTGRFGDEIADGNSLPIGSNGRKVKKLDYATATAIMESHGKGLLSVEEFFAAAFGVTEKTAVGDDPETVKLDAPRTSKWGIIQATGNMWTWGHDGDPDTPRASIFGGSWWVGGDAGSRQADVGGWPGYSGGDFGARGRCDHLQLG